jgi:hypothetical protein
MLAIAAGVLAALTAAPSAVTAQDKPVTLRYTSNGPPKSPWAVQIERGAVKTLAATKDSVKIEPYYGGQLGNEQDTIQQVARGRIDMGGFSLGSVSLLVPELQVAQLPFYFESAAEQDCVLDKHLAKPFDELLAARGLKLLGFGEVGAIDLIGKKAYANPADVKGIKAVSYTKIQAIAWSALGANSTFVGVPEWSSALQTGLIDAVGADGAVRAERAEQGGAGAHPAAAVVHAVAAGDQPGRVGPAEPRAARRHAEGRRGGERRGAAGRDPRGRAEAARRARRRRRADRRDHARAARGVARGGGAGLARDGQGDRRPGRGAVQGDGRRARIVQGLSRPRGKGAGG